MFGQPMKGSFTLLLLFATAVGAFAQSKRLPVLAASTRESTVTDGKHVRLNWHLDPNADPDIYYVNVPRQNSKVTFHTDKGELSFATSFGKEYDFLIVVNGRDKCHIRISAKDDPNSVHYAQSKHSSPHTIPFVLNGSRVYLAGKLNGDQPVNIQLDLGAGTSVVNKAVSEKLALHFDSKTTVSNTQGVAEARTSLGNILDIGNLEWKDLPFTEVGNMHPDEDLIIGNSLFRDKVIELDYDRKLLIVYDALPPEAKSYRVQPVSYEQNRPKFEATIRQNDRTLGFWFLFDTGRDGTMLIGEDLTGQDDNWNKLQAFQMLNGRKIVRLDAMIGGQTIKDIVTNAADPAKPGGRPTLFGNQVLNHFNMILDNERGLLYLKPNSRTNEPYSRYESDSKSVKP
jgi:hypothetical protein